MVNGKLENETSLGYPDVSLTALNDSAQLKYLRGDKCSNSTADDVSSSVVNFKCNAKAGRGRPVLTEVDEGECHYTFEWETNAVCKDTEAEYKDCAVTNKETGGVLNLTGIPQQPLVQGVQIDLCKLTDYETKVDYASQLVYLRANGTDVKDVTVEIVLECRGEVQLYTSNVNSKVRRDLLRFFFVSN